MRNLRQNTRLAGRLQMLLDLHSNLRMLPRQHDGLYMISMYISSTRKSKMPWAEKYWLPYICLGVTACWVGSHASVKAPCRLQQLCGRACNMGILSGGLPVMRLSVTSCRASAMRCDTEPA